MRNSSKGPTIELAFRAAAMAVILVSSLACSTDEETVEPETGAAEETSAAAEEPASPESFPEVVAKVNGTEIAKADLLERADRIAADPQAAPEATSMAFYRNVLEEIVGAHLLYQASQDRGLSADDAAVEQQLSALRGQFPDPNVFEQALAQQGITLAELKAQLARDLSIQNLIVKDIAPAITVTDDQKRQFYEENSEQMREPDRLRLSHILKRVDPDASAEDKEAIRAELEGILQEAKGDADFAALAREHSEDPGSAANGGELEISRGQTVPPFEQAAFALEPGGLSPVVETRFGFHIIKLGEKIEGQLAPYDEVEPRIEQFLRQQAVQEEVEETIESLKESASVELFI